MSRPPNQIHYFYSQPSGTHLHLRGQYDLGYSAAVMTEVVLTKCGLISVRVRATCRPPFGNRTRIIFTVETMRWAPPKMHDDLPPHRAHPATVVGHNILVIGVGRTPHITECTSLTSRPGIGCARHSSRLADTQHNDTLTHDVAIQKQSHECSVGEMGRKC